MSDHLELTIKNFQREPPQLPGADHTDAAAVDA
jgi:hypothetical protein